MLARTIIPLHKWYAYLHYFFKNVDTYVRIIQVIVFMVKNNGNTLDTSVITSSCKEKREIPVLLLTYFNSKKYVYVQIM